MIQKKSDNLSIYQFENLLKYEEVKHFVSTRFGGYSKSPYESLNLGFHVLDDADCVLKNRKLLFSKIGIPLNNLVACKQIHEGNVRVITKKMRGCGSTERSSALEATDAMITNVSDLCLMVLLADCVPVLFFDPIKKVVGVAHAGWRGTVKNVAYNTVENMKNVFGCQPSDIVVAIGASIGQCHYEVGIEVIEQVKKVFPKWEALIRLADNDKGYLNLWKANKYQLLNAGILEKNIEIAEICTYCQVDTFFSERHQGGRTGRFGVGIMLQ